MKKSSKKFKSKFICDKCNYTTSRKSQWDRHILTSKHVNGKNGNCKGNAKSSINICPKCKKQYAHKSGLSRHIKMCKSTVSKLSKIIQNYPKVIQSDFCCECGKTYKYASGLSKHKLKCKYLQNEDSYNDEIYDITPTNNVEILLKALLEKNNDILQENKAIHQKNDSILEENKILRQEIKNLKLGNTMINSNNNSFNINMFLNEKCKNAMNIEDFVEKIKLTLEDLQFTKENGYTKGISNIFIKNLNDMDITERPIHCSDQKRLQFYVKNDNEWSKDKNNEKIDNSIQQVSVMQLKSIQDWVEANPDYLESTAKTEEYFTLVRSITQPNDDKNLKNIKRKVGENVKLEK